MREIRDRIKRFVAVLLAIALTLSNFPESLFTIGTGTGDLATVTVDAEEETGSGTAGTSSNDAGSVTETEAETDAEETSTESNEEEAGIMLTATAGSTLQAQIDEITTAGAITLDDDYKEDIIIASGTEVTIDLNGYSIIAAGTDKNAITVYGTLILTDGSANGEGTVENNGLTNVRGVNVIQGGSFVMEGGTITGFSISGNGGGVLVAKNATFTMTGGTISDNTATGYGGGVYVYDADNIANMTGGTISGNTSETSGGGLSASTCTSGSMVLPSELKITGNTASSYGGGVYFNNTLTSLTISSTISDNESGSAGGGVYFGMSISTVNITDATIDGNTSGSAGGGCYFAVKVSSATITDSSISDNIAAGNGGGLWFTSGTSLTLESGSEINSNKITATGALYGGGIYLNSSSSAMSTFTSTGGEISENIITSENNSKCYGGGIYIGQYATVTMEDTTVYKNNGATYGGGIAVDSHAEKVTLTSLTVSDNYASASSDANTGHGGGVYIYNAYNSNSVLVESCVVTISGGTYSDNDADYQGGGIYVQKSLTLTDGVTVSGNTAYGSGGGIKADTLVLEGGKSAATSIKICGNTSKTSYGGGAYATSSTEYALTSTGYVEVYGNTTPVSNGGGLAVSSGSMYLSGNISIYGNTAANGGGLYSYSTSVGTIKLESGVEISENTVTGSGGGIYGSYNVEIGDGVSIHNNSAASGGGGVYAVNITMTGGEIYNNSANNGGGLYDAPGYGDSSDGSHISGGSIHDNTTKAAGGGIYEAMSDSNSNILNIEGTVEIYNNTASSNGGGVFSQDKLVFTGGSIHDNTASQGGGIFAHGYYGQTVTIGIAAGSTGIIYDNLATTANRGNDVALQALQTGHTVATDTNNGNLRAEMTIAAAETFTTTAKSMTDTSWYSELEAESTTSAIDVNNASTGYFYTFVYTEPDTYVAQVWNITSGGEYEQFTTVQAAVDAIAADSDKYGTKDSSGTEITIVMIADSREDVSITSGLTVTLDLNNYTLRGMAKSVITVETNADLTIVDNSTEGNGQITGGSGYRDTWSGTNTCGGGLFIYGTATLISGTITGNTAVYGAGVYVANTGTFIMSGGTITGNGYTSANGGGVYAYRSSYSTNADDAFIMTGGSITGNTASVGGGIYLRCAKATISSGSITDNTASTNGGGIYSPNNTTQLIITGGIITGNTVTSATGYGGGIYMGNVNSILKISDDAKIYDNTAASKMANDICMRLRGGTFSLLSASAASDGIYDSWYDAYTDGTNADYPYYYYNTEVSHNSISAERYFYLTATNYPSEYVAYIPDEDSATTVYQIATVDSGVTTYTYQTTEPTLSSNQTEKSAKGTAYTTLQAAINAADADDIIYLLCDQTEDVQISGKTVTIDLNGYTLYTEDAYGFKLTNGSSASTDFTIMDTSKDDSVTDKDTFHNPVEGAFGTLTPSSDNTNEFPRAIYSTSNVTYKTTITIDGVYITGYGNDEATDSSHNSATYHGGAVYAYAYNTIAIKGYSVLTGNAGCYGGAVYMAGNNVRLSIDDYVEITENNAYLGGGIYFDQGDSVDYTSYLTIGKATFSGNTAYNGGAMYVAGYNSAQNTSTLKLFEINLNGTVIIENGATNNCGGVYMVYVANVTIADCTITSNESGANYGGILIDAGSTVTGGASISVSGTTVSYNTAGTSNGGLAINYGVATISNCTFEENSAQSSSSAVLLNYLTGSSKVENSTIKGNTVTASGYAISMQNSVVDVSELDVIENTSPSDSSAVYVYNGSTSYLSAVNFTSCNFNDNSSRGLQVSLGTADGSDVVNLYSTTISGNGSYGIYITTTNSCYTSRDKIAVNIEDGTKIFSNGNSGIYAYYSTVNINGGEIYSNTASEYGGGVYARYANFNMTSGSIYGNTAKYGGGVSLVEDVSTYTDGKYSTSVVPDTITGGSIYGNTSTGTSESGGGIYISSYAELQMTGGTVTGNTSNGYGGGVYMKDNSVTFVLGEGSGTVGQVYDNTAVLGQDIYAAFTGSYGNTTLQLVAASTMLTSTADQKVGIGWLDEARDTVTTTSIDYNPVKKNYPLTLEYETDTVVAVILNSSGTYVEFKTVQAAVDALQEDYKSGTGTYYTNAVTSPEIILVGDATGNVEIPSGLTLSLNLNGYTLKGNTTAISCYGTLTIEDESFSESGYTAGTSTGTITGTAATTGGGVAVYSGGNVTMTSGQIANCAAGGANTGSSYGGAGVYIQSGTFTLGGNASINNCSTKAYGAAVYLASVSGTFILQDDAKIENNTGLNGTIYMLNGTFKMTGGTIQNNSVTTTATTNGYGGAVYMAAGTLKMSGGTITGNTATNRGGGIYLASGKVTLSDDAVITGNSTTAGIDSSNVLIGAGGGIFVAGGTLTIRTGTEITDNTAARGGGIFQSGGTITMSGGQITGNTAEYGGGIAQDPAGSGSYTLTGGVLCDNVASRDVGYDVYSTTDSGEKGSGSSSVTLISAASMSETGYTMNYNVWKDDTYSGSDLSGEHIGNGMYVTGIVSDYNGVQLTAAKYGELQETTPITTTAYVANIYANNEESSNGIVDGTENFDSADGVSYSTGAGLNTTWSPTTDIDKNPTVSSWTAGMDSSSSNGLVRSFDTVRYYLKAGVQNTNIGSNNVTLYVKVELEHTSDEVELDAISGLDYYETSESADGSVQYLTGYMTVAEVTGDNSFCIEVKVLGMKNGETVEPKFYAWIEENADNKSNPATLTPTAETVSATGRYNVTLERNTQLNYSGYFDLNTGEETTKTAYSECTDGSIIYGTMLGYGVTVSLWNTSNNGIKGIEIPEGDISFDLSISGKLTLTDAGGTETKTGTVAPYIWAYKANENTETGINLGGTSSSVNMNWNDEDDSAATTQYAYDGAPFNTRGVSTTAEARACYSGGSWAANGTNPTKDSTASSTTVTFTVSGYTIESAYNTNNPTQMSNGTAYSYFNNYYTRSFSAGYVQVIIPVDEDFTKDDSGYLTIDVTAITSDLTLTAGTGGIEDTSSSPTDSNEETVLSKIADWSGATAKNEIKYADNYVFTSTGLYVSQSGDESLSKTNYFRNGTNTTNIPSTQSNGNGSTVLGSEIYIGSTISYSTAKIDASTMQKPEDIENAIETNYLTAINLLQKFDADAYTPVGTDEPIVGVEYNLTTNKNYITSSSDCSFYIETSETATDWSGNTTKTFSYTLTILYAAKPSGDNWEYKQDSKGYLSPSVEMDEYTEDELIYFTSLQDLYDYFGYDTNGDPIGHCVGILYEFRNCCIRDGRNIQVRAKMQVTNDYSAVGNTYCITNDVLGWTTYRPTYKSNLTAKTLSNVLYDFSWTDATYNDSKTNDSGNTIYAYGWGNDGVKTAPSSYTQAKSDYEAVNGYTYTGLARLEKYQSGYIKTEYDGGYMVPGTHGNGYQYGNTLLIYTLTSDIDIVVSDLASTYSNASKKYYYLSKGEWVANYTVTPTLSLDDSVSNEIFIKGEVATKVVITLTLPKYLNYNEGSIEFDYEKSDYEEGELTWDVSCVENSDGTTTITIVTEVTNVTRKLPTIDYSATIGDTGNNTSTVIKEFLEKELTTKAEIYLAYDSGGTEQIATDTKYATATIIPTGETQEYIWMTGSGKLDLGSDLLFSLYYDNAEGTSAATVELGTILPYDGDYRGSSFSGSYQVQSITLTFTDEDSYKAYLGDWATSGATTGKLLYDNTSGLKYHLDNEYAVDNLDDIMDTIDDGMAFEGTLTTGTVDDGNGTTVGWTITYTLIDKEVAALTQNSSSETGIGLYVYLPSVASNNTVTIDINMATATTNTDGTKSLIADSLDGSVQQVGDKYYENMFYRDYGSLNASTLLSNSAYIHVVGRILSGIVWLDQDQDGVYNTTSSSTDQPLKDVDVYLYTDTLYKAAEECDTITLDGVYTDSTNSTLKTLYRAVDVLGNLLEPVATTENGLYKFENLPEGTYYVVFVDEGTPYTVGSTGEAPTAFSNLSVTDTSNLTTSGDYNKSEAEYTTNNTTGATELSSTYIKNLVTTTSDDPNGGTITTTTTGVSLPAVAEIEGTYVQGALNSGLCLTELVLKKTWENIIDLSDFTSGDTVSFEVVGTYEDSSATPITVIESDVVYTMTFDKVDGTTGDLVVNGTSTIKDPSNPSQTTAGDTFDVTVTTVTDSTTGAMTVTWTATIYPAPKTTNGYELTYHYAGYDGSGSTAADGFTESSTGNANGISGFKLSSVNFETETSSDGAVYTYSAVNTQIVYAVDIYKISSTTNGQGYTHYLAGAEFTLYSDDALTQVVKVATSDGTDATSSDTGEVWLAYLKEGTYYLKETKAPSGYDLNLGVWQIDISYDSGTGVSTFKVKLINDEETGEKLVTAIEYTSGTITAGTAAEVYNVTGYTASGDVAASADEACTYVITFEVEDEIVYSMPSIGRGGIGWMTLGGIVLMLLAVWLVLRDKEKNKCVKQS